jgi:hypothetical protein
LVTTATPDAVTPVTASSNGKTVVIIEEQKVQPAL